MKKNLRIGILNGSDLTRPECEGGASGFICSILPNLPFSVTVFGIGYSSIPDWVEMPLYPRVSFISIAHLMRLPRMIPKRLPTLLLYMANRRRILNSGVDVLYIHSPECAWPFTVFKSEIPVVFHQHGSANPVSTATFKWARNGFFRRIFDGIHNVIYKRSDWIIAIDRLCLDQAVRGGAAQKVSLIMNAVDSAIFKPDLSARKDARNVHGCAENDLVLLFAGRLEEVKRVDRIIDSLAFMREKIGAKLFIAGDGTLKENLRKQALEKGINNNVVFLGYVPHKELPALYNMADILMLPSIMEGTPMVVLEALACGTPAIATRVGGLPDLIENGENGFLLDDASPQDIAEAVMRISENPFDRLSVSKSVSRWYSDRVGQDITDIFLKCAEKRN